MLVEVLKSDISHGKQSDCRNCMMARAINRVLPEGYFAKVFTTDYDVFKSDGYRGDPAVMFQLPISGRGAALIRRFDTNKKLCTPGVFRFPVPTAKELEDAIGNS